MPSPAFIVVPSGGNIPADTPTLTYTSYAVFTITNYNSALTYNLGSNTSINANLLTVTIADGSGTVSVTSPKGQTSGTVTASRKPYATYFVQTGPTQVLYSTSPIPVYGGTYYAQDQWNPNDGSPAGYYAVVTPGYYQPYDYTSLGFTYSSTYNEWWKIV